MRTSRKIEEKKNYFFELYLNDQNILNTKKNKSPLLFILTRRTVIFLFLYLIVTTLFFVIGNYQKFIDSNLLIIIKIAAIDSILLACFSFVGIIESIYLIIICIKKQSKNKIYYFIHIIIMIIINFISIICLLAYRTINLLSQGINL